MTISDPTAVWHRVLSDGLLGQFHQPIEVDAKRGLEVMACGRTVIEGTHHEERELRRIPTNERCLGCQLEVQE